MKNKISEYNLEILNELKRRYPDKWDSLSCINKEKWLTKDDFPTYNQLVKISKHFDIPFGYLFLQKLPEKKLPIPHFRTKNNSLEFSDELFDTISEVTKLQIWAKEILIEWGNPSLPFVGKYSIENAVNDVVKEMQSLLNLQNGWASYQSSWKDAFQFLIKRFEEAGIFVIVNGIVGNNTHRKLDVNEFRGFVLYDDIAPFVFINNNDFLSAKIFTLIHELAHILIGKSAAFDLRELIPANNETEKFCNKCAAEFLVPESEIRNITDINYDNLARKFKVSQIVIARRLLDIGKISLDKFYEFYNNYIKSEKQQAKKSGGDFYNTAEYRYGKNFLMLLGRALNSKTILYRDVYRVLSLKPKTAEKLIDRIIKIIL